MTLAERQREIMAVLTAPRAPADSRLAIYHRSVRANQLAALAADFPVVRRLVGEAFFAGAAEAYAEAHPSRSGDLARLGLRMADFLAGYPPARALTYLPDVARLEWALCESARAQDAPACDFAALAAVPAQRHAAIRVRLHASVRLLESPHPVLAIWEANQGDRDGAIDPAAQSPDRVLVHRVAMQPAPRRLAPADFMLLGALLRGATLGELCDAMPAHAARLGAVLAEQGAAGVICGFELAA